MVVDEPLAGTGKPLVVVMGVSASGKSTVGKLLARRLGVVYADGDDFHSQANIAKMHGGTPLTDADRWPWLDAIGKWLHEQAGDGAVISCSALKRVYRDRLRAATPTLCFLHLCGGEQELRRRRSEERRVGKEWRCGGGVGRGERMKDVRRGRV